MSIPRIIFACHTIIFFAFISLTSLDFICTDKSKECVTKSRMLLGNMKFTKEEMEGNISALSNGEKAKLILAHLVLEKYNVLILDEPTRNVSPLSNPVIRLSFKKNLRELL